MSKVLVHVPFDLILQHITSVFWTEGCVDKDLAAEGCIDKEFPLTIHLFPAKEKVARRVH